MVGLGVKAWDPNGSFVETQPRLRVIWFGTGYLGLDLFEGFVMKVGV
jgi:hypothetical protein